MFSIIKHKTKKAQRIISKNTLRTMKMKIIKTQSKSKVKKGKSKIQNHDNLEEEEKLDFINPFSAHFTNVIKIGGQFFI